MSNEHTIDSSEILSMTPFTDEIGGRAIPALTFYNPDYDTEKLPDYMEGEEWFLFMQRRDGDFELVKGEPYESLYFGVEPADEDDVRMPFLDLYYQHLSWPDILGILTDLLEDVRNLAACLSKLAAYQQMSKAGNTGIRRFVLTELEYIFTVCRSLYDLLQFIASKTWSKMELVDGGKSDLPTTFSRMVLEGGEPRTADTFREKYDLIDGLATFYENEGEIFSRIRSFRDSIAHEGETVDTIFMTDDGLAVDTEAEPYHEFDAWSEDQIGTNSLAPLWPFVAHIIGHTISALNRFIEGLLEDPIHVPPRLVPDYELYVRGEHVHNINHIDGLQKDDPWGTGLVEESKEKFGWEST